MSINVTLLEMLEELESFGLKSEKKLEAKLSGISTKNNWKLENLVEEWKKGSYDEDPAALLNELEELL